MTSSSPPQTQSDTAGLGARCYEYRYPLSARLTVFAILIAIPLATAGFIAQAIHPGSVADRLLPGLMALILIGAGIFLAYRQAYFAWSIITVYERGLRFDFWRKHLIIPWNSLGKFYLGPGRAPKWQITDKEENILCELKTNAVGRAFSEGGSESAPDITHAIIEQGHMTLYETPFRHYVPAPKRARNSKKST